MEAQLCSKCSGIFSGTRTTHVDGVAHHQTPAALFQAADNGCYICRCIARQFQDQPLHDEMNFALRSRLVHPITLPDSWDSWLKLSIWQVKSPLDTVTVYNTEPGDTKQDLDSMKASLVENAELEGHDWPIAIGRNDIWGFTVWPTKDIAANVGHWVPPTSLEDPKLVELALSWYKECRNKHAQCNERGSTTGFMPTRLVHIGDLASRMVSVVASSSIPSSEYCTLSHCWGGFNPLKLLKDNQGTLETGTQLETLPASWKEAIHFAQHFGFSYIRIDSLCIIQDSEEDWRVEAATMCDVYSRSSLNIELAGAENSSEKSFSERDNALIRPYSVRATWVGLDHIDYSVWDEGFSYRDVQESKLWNRAWVVQECELAPRALVLGKEQVYYQCVESFACETCPGWKPELPQDSQSIGESILGRSRKSKVDMWKTTVERYSHTGITALGDRLIAIGGLARHDNRDLKDVYVAGLWRSFLPEQLLWHITRRKQAFRPDEYRAPSWSWASLEGPVQFFGSTKNTQHLCEVESVEIGLVDARDSYGQVSSGNIIMHGALIPVVAWEHNRIAVFERGRAVLVEESVHRMPDGPDDDGCVLGAYYTGDECDDAGEYSPAGDDVIPMMNRLTVATGLDEETDLNEIWLTEAWRFYCLPIESFVWDEEILNRASYIMTRKTTQFLFGQPGCFGLLLQKTDRDDEFVRIGSFEVAGAEQVKHFQGQDSCRLSII